VLLLAAAQLPCGGEAGGPFDEFMIEDGDADFERIQHAHAVNFAESVVDHIRFSIDVETRQVAFKTRDEGKLIDVTLLPGKRNVVGESASAHGARYVRKNLVAKDAANPAGNVLEDALAGVNAVAGVSGKHLVAAIAGKGDGDMLAGHLRNVISGQHGGIAERFFERTGEMLDGLDYVGFEDHLMMIGREFLGDDAGVVRLVEIVVLETDGEGLDRAGTGAGHHGDYGGGIDS